MASNDSANFIIALLAIVVGALNCFAGYRILKIILGIGGFCAGAAAGWALSAVWAPDNWGIGVLCALAGGILGAVLSIWLYFVGVFLLGAGFGSMLANGLLNASGSHPKPIIILIAAVVCGAIAVVAQKFMIILCTAFGGAYLLIGGVLHFLVGGGNPVPAAFDRAPLASWGPWGYVPAVLWLVLGLAGVALQYRGTRESVEVVHEQRAEA